MTVRIINADVMEGLRQLPDESVHCVVTSPPYWGLRDYGVDGQIGMEPTLALHIAKMVEVFREVRRVLRKDGTLWLNYGDCYATSINGRSAADTKAAGNDDRTFRDKPFSTIGGVLKAKDLCMIPHRLAIALQEDGWWVRSDIVWSKPNPMPESVTDRPTKSHEYVFLLTKSERYFYDAEAVREDGPTYIRQPGHRTDGNPAYLQGRQTNLSTRVVETTGRNKRSVWAVATAPFADAHFATFPPDLIEPMILAGTSHHGCCGECGAPWDRQMSKVGERPSHSGSAKPSILMLQRRGAKSLETSVFSDGMLNVYETIGWEPSCKCDGELAPCTVLDPFSGAGTTALVADRLQRHAIGIELNPEYAAMSERRVNCDRGGLLDIMETAE